MNIVLISAEVSPFAKQGGLADIAASLPKAWNSMGHNAIVVLPMYKSISVEMHQLVKTDIVLSVPMGSWTEYAQVWRGYLESNNQSPVYFIDNDDYYNRIGIYGNPEGFEDNDRRFLFLSRSAFELCKALQFKPDIIHAHDYHTALALPLLKIQYRHESFFSSTAGILTLHNLAYQGWYNPDSIMELSGWGKERFYKGSWFEKDGTFNAMKTGIMFADKITTVSPTYAKEIRATYFGEGLQDCLNMRGKDVIGILNGVDYNEWNPEQDIFIHQRYNASTISDKHANKLALHHEFSIPETSIDTPIIGMISRLTFQKGIELVEQIIEDFIYNGNIRLAILGSGEKKYEQYFQYLRDKYPDKVMVFFGYNNSLSHKIFAGSDFFLIPSLFEPCGLTQLYALKYGTIPIVRSTGGLADTVEEYNPALKTGTGFCFLDFNAHECASAIRRALSLYNNQEHWNTIRHNAMSKDYSIIHSASEYIQVFHWALENQQ